MTGEHQLKRPILEALAESEGGKLTTTQLRRKLRKALPLAAEDLAPLSGRSDQRIDQIIRNVKSHRTSAGNPFAEGLLSESPGGFRITDMGRRALKK